MRLLAIGDNVVDRYLGSGMVFPGGNAVNVAVQARRAGAEAAYWGVVGTDVEGDIVVEALQDEDVDISRVRRRDGPTAYANVTVLNGERSFKGSDSGVSGITLTEDDYATMRSFDVVHTGYKGSLVDCVPRIAVETRVSFDFSYVRDAEYVGRILRVLFLATFSGAGMSDREVDVVLRRGIEGGARFVLLTRGRDGAWLASSEGVLYQPAQVVGSLDSMGAGDAFIARLLVGLLSGEGAGTALGHAAAMAAAACLSPGGFGHGRSLRGAWRGIAGGASS
jgi:fructoselysine 6-kinase